MAKIKLIYKWNKSSMQNLLCTSDDAVKKALLSIYEFQTQTEKSYGSTIDHNGIGFSGCDGEILSSFAEQLKRKNYLSLKQMEIARKKMCKYWNQLCQIATEKGNNPVINMDDPKVALYMAEKNLGLIAD